MIQYFRFRLQSLFKAKKSSEKKKRTIGGVWRSWLARLVWDQKALGSSPSTPTISDHFKRPFQSLLGYFEIHPFGGVSRAPD